MSRAYTKLEVETEVLTRSKRRCSFCVGLNNDHTIKVGQIAHVNQDNTDARFENLAFLCLTHHNEYDSKTSVSKNLTASELKQYRAEVYRMYGQKYELHEYERLEKFARKYGELFTYLSEQGSEIAFSINKNAYLLIQSLATDLKSSDLFSYNSEIRPLQEQIISSACDATHVFHVETYYSNGSSYMFDNMNHSNETLNQNRSKAQTAVVSLLSAFAALHEILVS